MKGSTFNRSFCSAKIKFYKCFNGIYNKAFCASEEVVLHLFKSYCLPIITYACNSLYPSKRDIKFLNKLINVVFSRIFHTSDYELIAVIRDYCELSDISDMLINSHKKFVAGF